MKWLIFRDMQHFFFDKHASVPELNLESVKIMKGPIEIQVWIAKLIDQTVELGTLIIPKGEPSDKNLKVQTIEVTLSDGSKIKVAGIDYFATEDIHFTILNKDLSPNLVIKQGTNYVITEDSNVNNYDPVQIKVSRPDIDLKIYRTSADSTKYDDILIYKNSYYSFDNLYFWKGNIDFLIIDDPPKTANEYRYSIIVNCNVADEYSPIVVSYSALVIKQA